MSTLWRMSWCGLAFGAILGSGCAGRSTAREDAVPPSEPAIASVYRSRCGACHVPIVPGENSRAYLEKAFDRHRKRVHLSEDQWSAMVDYLAKPGPRPPAERLVPPEK
jgi:hypothetical protein